MKRNYTPAHIYSLALILLSSLAWFAACEEKEDFVPLRIFTVEPAEVYVGDTIAIIGEGFSPGLQYNRVFFAGAAAAVQPLEKSTGEKLWIQVPEGIGSGPVTVNLFDEEIAETPIPISVKIPVIKEIVPAEGLAGDTIIIHGENFRPVATTNTIRFHPNSLGRVISGGSTELKVVIPPGSVTGVIRILGFAGPEFKIIPPVLTGISPLKGIVGETISILGKGLDPSPGTDVTFNGSGRATVLEGSTTRELKVAVPEDAKDGLVTLKFGAITLSSTQVFEVYPSITSVVPKNSVPGMTITINGYSFSNTPANNKIYFNGVLATVTSATLRQLKVTVPAAVTTGPVTAEVNGRSAIGPVFELSAPGTPLITALEPASGPIGSLLSIEGDNFSAVVSENTVLFTGNVTAQVVSASAKQLTVRVPQGAATGVVTVTKENKTGTGPEFSVTEKVLPFVSSVSPAMVQRGANFTIYGGNFGPREDVQVDLVANTPKQLVNPNTATPTELNYTMPINTVPGAYGIRVRQYGDGVNSNDTITVEGNPQITSLSGTEGFEGSTLTITGTEFHNIEYKNTVNFTAAGVSTPATFTNRGDVNLQQVTVAVPHLPDGTYQVTVTAFGNESNVMSFVVKHRPLDVRNIYYALKTGDDFIRLEKATLGVATPEVIYQPALSGGSHIKAMAIDLVKNKIYFITNDNILARSNFDNTGYEALLTGLTGLTDISLDVAGEKIYWSAGKEIRRVSMAGGTPELIYTVPGTGTLQVKSLTYNAANNRLYFCEQVGALTAARTTVIRIDPNNVTDKVNLINQMNPAPVDLKIDNAAGKMFLLCGTSASSAVGIRRKIYVADLNGNVTTTPLQEYTATATGTTAIINGIALDTQSQYVYWIKNETTAEGAMGVYRKRYDGQNIAGTNPPSNIEFLYTVTNQQSTNNIGGLALQLPVGSGQNQRGFSMSLSVEFTVYENE